MAELVAVGRDNENASATSSRKKSRCDIHYEDDLSKYLVRVTYNNHDDTVFHTSNYDTPPVIHNLSFWLDTNEVNTKCGILGEPLVYGERVNRHDPELIDGGASSGLEGIYGFDHDRNDGDEASCEQDVQVSVDSDDYDRHLYEQILRHFEEFKEGEACNESFELGWDLAIAGPRDGSNNSGFIAYTQKVNQAYKSRQGDVLGRLLCLRDRHVDQVMPAKNCYEIIKEQCDISEIIDIVTAHVKCMKALLKRNLKLAFTKQVECIMSITILLESPEHLDEDWTLPILHAVSVDLRILTEKVATTGILDVDTTILDVAADALLGLFRICSQPGSVKKEGTMGISDQLLCIFFAMKQIGLCRPLLLDYPIAPLIQGFPHPSQRPAFLNFAHADDFYAFAFNNCPPEFEKHKKLILIRLVPLQMAKGIMPSRNLMLAHDCGMLYELAVAIENGNVEAFDTIVEVNNKFFIDNGINEFIVRHLRYEVQKAAHLRKLAAENKEENVAPQVPTQGNVAGEMPAAASANNLPNSNIGGVRRYYVMPNGMVFLEDDTQQ